MSFHPWLAIPLDEYEGHMSAVGQSQALRTLFARAREHALRRAGLGRVLVLGCTSGADFELLDRDTTGLAVGVDINPHYLEVARRRTSPVGRVELVCGDVLEAPIPGAPFDLVHAALLVEYIDAPERLFRRVRGLLADEGILSLVSQEPVTGIAPVSSTPYLSLRALSGCMALRGAGDLARIAEGEGLRLHASERVELPGGKILTLSLFIPERLP